MKQFNPKRYYTVVRIEKGNRQDYYFDTLKKAFEFIKKSRGFYEFEVFKPCKGGAE